MTNEEILKKYLDKKGITKYQIRAKIFNTNEIVVDYVNEKILGGGTFREDYHSIIVDIKKIEIMMLKEELEKELVVKPEVTKVVKKI